MIPQRARGHTLPYGPVIEGELVPIDKSPAASSTGRAVWTSERLPDLPAPSPLRDRGWRRSRLAALVSDPYWVIWAISVTTVAALAGVTLWGVIYSVIHIYQFLETNGKTIATVGALIAIGLFCAAGTGARKVIGCCCGKEC